MAADEDWKTAAFRALQVAKLGEAARTYEHGGPRTSEDAEINSFQHSSTKEEYIRRVNMFIYCYRLAYKRQRRAALRASGGGGGQDDGDAMADDWILLEPDIESIIQSSVPAGMNNPDEVEDPNGKCVFL